MSGEKESRLLSNGGMDAAAGEVGNAPPRTAPPPAPDAMHVLKKEHVSHGQFWSYTGGEGNGERRCKYA